MKRFLRSMTLICAILCLATVGGVYADWVYGPSDYLPAVPIDFLMKQPDIPIIVNDAGAQFEQILNTGETLNRLLTEMDAENGNRNNTYIGNVKGADDADIAMIEELFGDKLNMEIDGENKTVNMLIKRENIDDNTSNGEGDGSEMVMYYTDESLDKSFFASKNVTVYAIIFIKNNGGEWTQLGPILTGKAPVVDYRTGSTWSTGGSFNTDDWREEGTNSTISGVVDRLLAAA